MDLRGQANRRKDALEARPQAGFAMAALLVAIAILSVVMLVALPTWSHQAQREKEAELVFRGEQYARAIGAYRRKMAGAYPPSIDVLVEQKFLRKKYKDPITDDDFAPVLANSPLAAAVMQQAAPQQAGPQQAPPRGQGPASTTAPGPGRGRVILQSGPQSGPVAGAPGGIVGVVSKSKAKSIRLYNGRDQYDQWVFIETPNVQPAGPAPGQGPTPAQGSPLGGRGSTGPGRGGRGQ